MNQIKVELDNKDIAMNLRKSNYLHEVARYVGQLLQAEQREHADAMKKSGNGNAEASIILGGQIEGMPPEIYLIYPQGNYISASLETPYLQIGENKYGKPILDRIITPTTSLEDAARCALVSLESTVRSNISVGPPLELAIYTVNSLSEPTRLKLTLNSPMYKSLQKRWNEGLQRVFNRLPRFDWEQKPTMTDD
ncbi:hypothetical protein W03_24160 [Nitrosomonas sp. PY1]|nr:hypothetical protein W03_24160 [Nitrosomonas sp. PY1]